MSAKNWPQAKTAAFAILGHAAKIPEPKIDPAKLTTDIAAAHKEFLVLAAALKTKISTLHTYWVNYINIMKQHQAAVHASNFDLPGTDAPKIEQAKKLLDEFFDIQLVANHHERFDLEQVAKQAAAFQKI